MEISKKTFKFLEELKDNNNREWFNDNKPRYLEAKGEFEEFVGELLLELGKMDRGVSTLHPRECVYRIYRDARFSKNKVPYKTNIGAHIVPGGRKLAPGRAGYYVHIEPGNCFLGGGTYMPPSARLAEIRKNLDRSASEFRKIIGRKKFVETFGEIRGVQLKTAPRDYPKDHPDIDLLRYKSFFAIHNLKDSVAQGSGYVKYCSDVFKVLYPFDQFLNKG